MLKRETSLRETLGRNLFTTPRTLGEAQEDRCAWNPVYKSGGFPFLCTSKTPLQANNKAHIQHNFLQNMTIKTARAIQNKRQASSSKDVSYCQVYSYSGKANIFKGTLDIVTALSDKSLTTGFPAARPMESDFPAKVSWTRVKLLQIIGRWTFGRIWGRILKDFLLFLGFISRYAILQCAGNQNLVFWSHFTIQLCAWGRNLVSLIRYFFLLVNFRPSK